jgi:hypothetical protein
MAIRHVYTFGYAPLDEDVARKLLREARFPCSAVLDFVDPIELSRDRLVDALVAGDWPMLARLRCTGVILDTALAGLRDEDENFGLRAGVTIDWGGLDTKLNKAAALVPHVRLRLARQPYHELAVFADLAVHGNVAAMLLRDDVVGDR